MTKRDNTKKIMVGGVAVGGGSHIPVQSMCTAKTSDVPAVTAQIRELAVAGCEIIRLAVPDMDAARAISDIKSAVNIPIVADIHFDYRLAVEAAARGADKIRINPGNIGGAENVAAVAKECSLHNVPIRIGINGGSLDKALLQKYGHPTAEALVESAKGHVRLLNDCGFDDICLSLKSSSVALTVEAYRLAAEEFNYPLHLGVTETGTVYNGMVRSAVGIGTLLMEGIGDTLRVSLTADPVEEVRAGISILKACELRRGGVRFVSCPTCGRTEIDLIGLANRVEASLHNIDRDITVAVMGCVVNGPGEAREADYGIAGGRGSGLLFKKGEVVGRVSEEELLPALLELINREGEV